MKTSYGRTWRAKNCACLPGYEDTGLRRISSSHRHFLYLSSRDVGQGEHPCSRQAGARAGRRQTLCTSPRSRHVRSETFRVRPHGQVRPKVAVAADTHEAVEAVGLRERKLRELTDGSRCNGVHEAPGSARGEPLMVKCDQDARRALDIRSCPSESPRQGCRHCEGESLWMRAVGERERVPTV